MPTTGVNRVADLQILKHSLSFVTAFAADVKDAAGESRLNRSGFGAARVYWAPVILLLTAIRQGKIRMQPWNV